MSWWQWVARWERYAKAACKLLQAAFANVLRLYYFVLICQGDGEAEGFAVAMPNADFVFFTVVDEFEAGGGLEYIVQLPDKVPTT